MEGDEVKPEGLCIQCARELNIGSINQMIDKLGISDEELEQASEQMSQFMENMGDFNFGDMSGMFNSENMDGAQTMPFANLLATPANWLWMRMKAVKSRARSVEKRQQTPKRRRQKVPKHLLHQPDRQSPGRQAGRHYRQRAGDLPHGTNPVPPYQEQSLSDRRAGRG